jgi:2-hydroxychromene-2-carboxylate isomerase
MMLDVVRKARRLGVPIARPPRIRSCRCSRCAPRSTLEPELAQARSTALFRAVWAESVDVSDAREVERVLGAAGLDGERLVAFAQGDGEGAARIDRARDRRRRVRRAELPRRRRCSGASTTWRT